MLHSFIIQNYKLSFSTKKQINANKVWDDEMMGFQNSESLVHQLRKPGILKAITQLLVSVSMFYYIISRSSCSSFILHSLKFYLSAIPLHSLDKRWMFLICNGIFLVILANASGFVSSPSSGGHDSLHKAAAEEVVPVFLIESSTELDGNAVSSAQDEKNDQVDHQCFSGEEQEAAENDEEGLEAAGHELLKMEEPAEEEAEEIKICIIDDEENENHSDEAGFDDLLEEEEEEEQEPEGREEEESGMLEKLSAEELNKKFEDFIRKMKEELRIEAQQQHLVVVK